MFFGKEKIYLGTFCRIICSDVIQFQSLPYEKYLQADSEKVLSKGEYEAFNNELPNYRILLLVSGVLQKSSEGKIPHDSEEIGKIFVQALQLAYEDNNYSEEEKMERINLFVLDVEKLFDYIETIDDKEISDKGLMFHASMYFSKKFKTFADMKNDDYSKQGTFVALTNNNRKIIKDYFQTSFKKVKIINDNTSKTRNSQKNETIEYSFEFNQFLSKVKTNYDQHLEELDDKLLVISLASFCARFFYIADDRQFYLIKSYLLDLFSSEFNTTDELYGLKVSENIFSLIFNSLTEKEQDAVLNLFGKGDIFPFESAPVMVYGQDAYEDDDKPFSTYKYTIKLKNSSVSSTFKMPIVNPTKIFTPLALGFMIEFVYLNLKEEEYFDKSKKVMIDMLALMNDRKFSERHLVSGVLVKNQII